jgi:transcriptional regulator with XRE-family HTH domain
MASEFTPTGEGGHAQTKKNTYAEGCAPGEAVRDLAEATGLHRNTINNIEVGRYAGDPKTLAAIEKVLTRAGVEFTNGDQPGVRLRKPSPKPKG